VTHKKKIVVFTGAGISQESGIKTFRDNGGLWEDTKIEDVATPEAWKRDSKLVNEFYNQIRKQILNAKPNKAHLLIAAWQKKFDVQIITQNVDDLHERAGSKKVLHLHGEIIKSRSSLNDNLIYNIKGWEIKIGDKCENGSQLRPHIVWFGENVPNMNKATEITAQADIFVTIGTSLNVYPAAGLIENTKLECSKYLIDPSNFSSNIILNLKHIKEKASSGIEKLTKIIEKMI